MNQLPRSDVIVFGNPFLQTYFLSANKIWILAAVLQIASQHLVSWSSATGASLSKVSPIIILNLLPQVSGVHRLFSIDGICS